MRKGWIVVGVIIFLVGLFFFFAIGNGLFGFIMMIGGLILSVMGVRGEGLGGSFGKKGGIEGVVKNLNVEGGLANFWLVSRDTGEQMPVEAKVGDARLNEGDIVWVDGKRGGDGILRTSRVVNVSLGDPSAGRDLGAFKKTPRSEGSGAWRDMKPAKGWAEFSGQVISPKPSFIREKKRGPYTRQIFVSHTIQRFDRDGNPAGKTEVVMDRDYEGGFHLGDEVWIKGKWDKFGRVEMKEARNHTTQTVIMRRKRFGWVKKVAALVIILVILYVLFSFLKAAFG